MEDTVVMSKHSQRSRHVAAIFISDLIIDMQDGMPCPFFHRHHNDYGRV